MTTGKQVYLAHDDVDRHGLGCRCGLCNAAGKSYGVGLYDLQTGEVEERVHAPSPEAAAHNAHLTARREGWRVVDPPDEEG